MTAIIRNYSGISLTTPAGLKPFGSLTEAIGEATLTGNSLGPSELIIPAVDYSVLWQQTHGRVNFSQMGFRIIGSGTLQVAWRTDLPTSSSNYLALGTAQRWHHKDWPCKMGPFWLCSQTVMADATLTNDVADSTGVPRLWAAGLAGAVSHVVDRFAVRNPGASPVTIEFFHCE